MIKIAVSELNIIVSEAAKRQLSLIISHDFTLSEQVFRLQVDGKGCGGFDYAIGFTEAHQDDLILEVPFENQALKISIDPFTAFYSKEGKIDYIEDFENNIEGFSFTNANEHNYKGKFFKDETMVPPKA